jgi:mannose-6-phosphate isomerase-like protein (cupin superfamily)
MEVLNDEIAPDGSEIYHLSKSLRRGSFAQCILPVGKTSKAVCHKTIDEFWFFLEGEGEVWRKLDQEEEVVNVSAGVCLTIPVGTYFQFRNTGNQPLKFIIVTMPPWPGMDESSEVNDYWDIS